MVERIFEYSTQTKKIKKKKKIPQEKRDTVSYVRSTPNVICWDNEFPQNRFDACPLCRTTTLLRILQSNTEIHFGERFGPWLYNHVTMPLAFRRIVDSGRKGRRYDSNNNTRAISAVARGFFLGGGLRYFCSSGSLSSFKQFLLIHCENRKI